MDAPNPPLKLHFLPFPAPGHITPLCQMARSFAAHGHHVTIITTPSNAKTLQNSIHNDTSSAHQINIHTVEFLAQEAELPHGVENLVAATDSDTAAKICHAATSLLRETIEHFILQNPPDCLVADFMFPWAHDVATRLSIPRLVFNSFCVFSLCAILHSIKSDPDPDPGHAPEPYNIPGLPLPIIMNARPPVLFMEVMEERLEIGSKSHGLLVNGFAELDGDFVKHYAKITGHKAWHVGPSSLMMETTNTTEEKQNESRLLSWLDSKPPDSVLYICFGSSSHFSDAQLHEIARGIHASGHSFVWVVPSGKDDEEVEKWLPRGMEERGKILRGWAPQVMILRHVAVGGFMTHCGWNSVVESVGAGVPMLTWPLHSDQFFNEKLVTRVQGIGVEVGAEEWCLWVFDERKKVVRRESIERGVRRLMDGREGGGEGDEMRRRARELGRKAREAVEEGGSSRENLKTLIRELQRVRDSKLNLLETYKAG